MRACAANLKWETQELLVTAGASQVDLDAFGVDLGDGTPVAAFQIKNADSYCCMDYADLFSPRTAALTPGHHWRGLFQRIRYRFRWHRRNPYRRCRRRGRLGEADAGRTGLCSNRFLPRYTWPTTGCKFEFQSYFDDEIAGTRAGIHAQDLYDFKNSDGALVAIPTTASTERLHRLRMVKIKVLEIVWAYLYSGREEDGFGAPLLQMWPPAACCWDSKSCRCWKTRARGIQ